jgi:hypothetical protein
LIIYDIESGKEKYKVKAHEGMGNSIDGIGGKGPEYGAPEIVTGGTDGRNLVLIKRLCESLGSKIGVTCGFIRAIR